MKVRYNKNVFENLMVEIDVFKNEFKFPVLFGSVLKYKLLESGKYLYEVYGGHFFYYDDKIFSLKTKIQDLNWFIEYEPILYLKDKDVVFIEYLRFLPFPNLYMLSCYYRNFCSPDRYNFVEYGVNVSKEKVFGAMIYEEEVIVDFFDLNNFTNSVNNFIGIYLNSDFKLD